MKLPLDPEDRVFGLSRRNAILKRLLDVVLAGGLIFLLWWLILILAWIARIDTGNSGLFKQKRVGLFGVEFTLLKLRTMRIVEGFESTVTTKNDRRVTKIGAFLRKWKFDELPQLLNVLNGTMSFVGPRPDVKEAYDGVDRDYRKVLTVRPGITGPASIYYRNEDEILDQYRDPEKYNREIVFPRKLELNMEYVSGYSFSKDVGYIFKTMIKILSK